MDGRGSQDDDATRGKGEGGSGAADTAFEEAEVLVVGGVSQQAEDGGLVAPGGERGGEAVDQRVTAADGRRGEAAKEEAWHDEHGAAVEILFVVVDLRGGFDLSERAFAAEGLRRGGGFRRDRLLGALIRRPEARAPRS